MNTKHTPAQSHGEVIEVVVCSAKPGVPAARVHEAMRALQRWVEAQPGYRARELVEAGARLVDIVRWGSMEEARAAGERAMQTPECLAAFEVLDAERVEILHGHAVALR